MWQITFTYTVCKVYIDIRSDIYYRWAHTTQIEAREKIDCFIKALKLTWIRRMINGDSQWKILFTEFTFQTFLKTTLFCKESLTRVQYPKSAYGPYCKILDEHVSILVKVYFYYE